MGMKPAAWRALLLALLLTCLLGDARADASGFIPLNAAGRRQIDTLAQQTMARQHLAGFSLAIARDGKIVYARGYGYRDVAKRLAATPQTIYNIGSITKQFTSACVLLLQQDKKLRIDDTLDSYVPSLPWGRQVTLRQLLDHTSGIPDYLDIVDNRQLSISNIVSALRKTHLKFQPGSRFDYSNSNYVLSGMVVRAVSGMPYDDFLRQRILLPLRLRATTIGTSPLSLADGAVGYTVVKGKLQAVDPKSDSVAELDFSDGGVNSNILDLVKWDQALDTGRVLDDQTLRLMFTPSPRLGHWPLGYALGLGVDRVNGHRELVHDGQWTGYAGENATFPEDRFDIVILSNTDTFAEDDLKKRIFSLFYPSK